MKYIDLETYPRRSHYEFFKAMAYPYVGMTANVDVTNILAASKRHGGSSFLGCLWVAANAANAVPELRQRIIDDKIVEFEHCGCAHTVALPDRTFCNCTTDCSKTFAEFLPHGKERQDQAKSQHGFVQQGDDETAMFFFSCVPWVAFTQVIQPAPIPADCNPRIVFGKFIQEGDKTLMPLGIQCNHALVDGWHIGEFFRIFQALADQLS